MNSSSVDLLENGKSSFDAWQIALSSNSDTPMEIIDASPDPTVEVIDSVEETGSGLLDAFTSALYEWIMYEL